jgi:hypothetical protein
VLKTVLVKGRDSWEQIEKAVEPAVLMSLSKYWLF